MTYDSTLWFGPYGGCFISDAFSLACDQYFELFKQAAADPDFNAAFSELCRRYQPPHRFCERGSGLLLCEAGEDYGSILGTALLAQRFGRKAVCGVRYADEALVCAQVCRELGVPLHLFLARELAALRTLTDQLDGLGVTYDTKMCSQIFNLPEMYAFQAWVSAPEEKHLINCRCNVGAFPQVNIASAFSAPYGEEIMAQAARRFGPVSRVVVPAVSGSVALSITKAAHGIPVVCVECDTEPDLKEELDSYCGTFTKVMRNNFADRVLCPELMYLVDGGQAQRVCAAPSEAMSIPTPGLWSMQSRAALAYCEAHPADGLTLCLVRNARWGAAL